MRKLTDQEFEHVLSVFKAIHEGKDVQWLYDGKWTDALLDANTVWACSNTCRVKPEPTTVTVYVHRMPDGKIIANEDDYSKCGTGWELLYSFEHEVQQ